MTSVTKAFADSVIEGRKKLNLSQSELARRIGVSPQFISQFEAGQTNIALHHAMAIAVVLGLGTDEMIQMMNTARQANLNLKRPKDAEP